MSLEKLERFLDYLAHNYLYGAKTKELNDPFEGRFNLKGLSKETKNNIYKKLNRTRICSMFKGKPQFRSVFPCDAILYVEMSFCGSICCYEDYRGFLGLAEA